MDRLFELDCDLFRAIHGALFGTVWETVLWAFQLAGRWQGMVPLLAVIVGLAPRGRRAQVGFRVIASLLIAAGVGQALKRTVHAPRPASLLKADMNPGFWEKPGDDGDYARHGYSWPSGHTTAVFAVAAAVLALGAQWRAVVPLFVLAALTGLGRIALGAHFPSDVLAGALVGSLAAYLAARPLARVEAAWLRRGSAVPLVGPAPIPVSAPAPAPGPST